MVESGYLNEYIRKARWYRGKESGLEQVSVDDFIYAVTRNDIVILLFLNIALGEEVSLYFLPVLVCKNNCNIYKLNQFTIDEQNYYIYEAIHSQEYCQFFMNWFRNNEILLLKQGGKIKFNQIEGKDNLVTSVERLTDVSSNSLTIVSREEIIKTYRQLWPGINPELEISLALAEETDFKRFPEVRGFIEYITEENEYILAILEQFIPNEGDMWTFTQDVLLRMLSYLANNQPVEFQEIRKVYQQSIEQIGILIADFHLALSGIGKKAFKPANFSQSDISEWLERIQFQLDNIYKTINNRVDIEEDLEDLYYRTKQVLKNTTLNYKQIGLKIRIHGDLHLGQIIKNGKEYYLLDFEGEPLLNQLQRAKKISPLKDLAGVIRSFNYSRYVALDSYQKERLPIITEKLEEWENDSVKTFLSAYQERVLLQKPEILPQDDVFLDLLAFFKLEKVLYECLYELENRPGWLHIPLKGFRNCVEELIVNSN